MFNDPVRLNNPYIPTKCLVVYEEKQEKNGVYMELHSIKNGVVREGQPLTKITLRKLLERCSKELTKPLHQKSINYNLLFYNGDALAPEVIWRVPSKLRNIYFSTQLGIPEGKVRYPNLLFHVDEVLTIYIYEKWKNSKTVLLETPFHNTNDGVVCLGNLSKKDEFDSLEELMEHYETMFFQSEFSHAANEKFTAYLKKFWTPLVNSAAPFPYEKLKPLKTTLDDL